MGELKCIVNYQKWIAGTYKEKRQLFSQKKGVLNAHASDIEELILGDAKLLVCRMEGGKNQIELRVCHYLLIDFFAVDLGDKVVRF